MFAQTAVLSLACLSLSSVLGSQIDTSALTNYDSHDQNHEKINEFAAQLYKDEGLFCRLVRESNEVVSWAREHSFEIAGALKAMQVEFTPSRKQYRCLHDLVFSPKKDTLFVRDLARVMFPGQLGILEGESDMLKGDLRVESMFASPQIDKIWLFTVYATCSSSDEDPRSVVRMIKDDTGFDELLKFVVHVIASGHVTPHLTMDPTRCKSHDEIECQIDWPIYIVQLNDPLDLPEFCDYFGLRSVVKAEWRVDIKDGVICERLKHIRSLFSDKIGLSNGSGILVWL